MNEARTAPRSTPLRLRQLAVAMFATTALLLVTITPVAADEVIENIDPPIAGSSPSIALDSSGNPIIAVWQVSDLDLAIIQCNDPGCAPGGETTNAPDTTGIVGAYPSLQLDAAGNPVVAYHDSTNSALKLLHCDDPACAPGGDTTNTVDAGNVGLFPSLALDAAGNPVIAYYDLANGALKIAHCDDPNCAAGGDAITTADTGNVGLSPSLALDSFGNPVVAYHSTSTNSLKVLHCDDRDCAPGGNSVTIPDATNVGRAGTSLLLEAGGNPIIAYHDQAANKLRVLRCNDPDCAPGGDNISSPDDGGAFPAMRLDDSGYPIIAHRDSVNQRLRVLRCDDPSCDGSGESSATPSAISAGSDAISMQLDSNGNPVVAFRSTSLAVLRCDDPGCNAAPRATNDNYFATEDEPFIEPAPGVLANDDDPDSTTVTAQVLTEPTKGTVELAPDGSFTYSPSPDETGLDSFTYEVTDQIGTDEATVTLLIAAVNDGPVAADDAASTAFETSVSLNVIDGTAGGEDLDVDQNTLQVIDVTDPADGQSRIDGAGVVTYTPNSNFAGTDGFTYTVSDGSVSAIATVTITVQPPVVMCGGLIVTINMNFVASGIGTPGDDVILGTPGPDVIDGMGGDDTICGEGGDDNLSGSAGKDFIYGGEGNDVMLGGDGNDRLRGQQDIDTISGGPGNDFLYGGVGGDTIIGGDGNDTIGGFGGDDIINAGAGDDTVFGGFGADNISGGDGNDEISGLIGNDRINGDAGDDVISGNNGQDTLTGGFGNDELNGGNSIDTLRGDEGDDQLNGGKSEDSLSGGDGTDVCTGNLGIDSADSTCETTFGVP